MLHKRLRDRSTSDDTSAEVFWREVSGSWEGEKFFEHGGDAVEGCDRVFLEAVEDCGCGEGGRWEKEGGRMGMRGKKTQNKAEAAEVVSVVVFLEVR